MAGKAVGGELLVGGDQFARTDELLRSCAAIGLPGLTSSSGLATEATMAAIAASTANAKTALFIAIARIEKC